MVTAVYHTTIMSILTNTTWPSYMDPLIGFAKATGEQNNSYNGLYLSILSECFKGCMTIVRPEKHALTSMFLNVVTLDDHPLLITAVQNKVSVNRSSVDRQIRQKYDELLSECSLPHLWGLSFVGSMLRVYRGDPITGSVEPPLEDPVEEAWNIDIDSPEAFAKIKEIVMDIRDRAGFQTPPSA